MKRILTSLLLLGTGVCTAQHHCISQQSVHQEDLHFPDELTIDIDRWLQHNPTAAMQRQVLQIPTVVHVIWKNPQENLADSLIHRTIEMVNRDWRRQHADTVNTPAHFLPVAADMGIELVLASTDPEGSPTDGITRTYSDSTGFSQWHEHMKYDSTGGKTAWNPDEYVNIWTVRDIEGTPFGSVLGVSTMPGLEYEVPGICVRTGQLTSSGLNNYGWRTLTHELAHFFCLLHICANDTCYNADLVDDTPICEMGNFVTACTDTVIISCDNGPSGNMLTNFLEYGSAECLNLFTQGQRERAIGCINTNYPGLLTSPGLGIGQAEYATVSVHPNPTTGLLRFETKTAEVFTVHDLMGRIVMDGTATRGQNTLDINALPDGIYLLRLHSGATARVVKVNL